MVRFASVRLWFHVPRSLLRLLALTLLAGFASSCSPATSGLQGAETDSVRRLVILYTNDEHGWMESYKGSGGAAGMLHLWEARDGYDPEGPFLILSGGDMWTGPAISTSLAGTSMTAVMNQMGYRAAALGNHDFDFGVSTIRARASEANFPFLGANIVDKRTGEPPDYVQPYTILDVNGIRVGVIGLTTRETPSDTHPAHVDGLRFIPYDEALLRYVPEMRRAGADLIFVAGHICANDMRELAPLAADLGVDVIGGGHCHQKIVEEQAGIPLVQSTSYLMGYNKIQLLVDTDADTVIERQVEFVKNKTYRRNRALQSEVEGWRLQMPPALGEVIGYTRSQIDDDSPAMESLITGSWLEARGTAQLALASPRYVHQHIPKGEITVETIVGILPVDNHLVEMSMTGEQVRRTIQKYRPFVGGLDPLDPQRLADGSQLEDSASYRVLVPENLYFGGAFYKIAQYDSNPAFTDINWRDPVIDWLRRQETDRRRPLDELLGLSVEPRS